MESKELEALRNKTALVVDDDETTRRVMENMMKKRMKDVFLATNGKEALDTYHDKKPDVIITDIEMPVMNGLALLERLKELKSGEPVIIITAFIDEAHRADQADAVIIKPVHREFLFGELLRLLH